MISPINFTGKAYFLDDALKTMTPEQKQRIETYAKNKGEGTDVVVINAAKEDMYGYEGKFYPENKVGCYLSEEGPKIEIETDDGIKQTALENVEIKTRPLPVYNAYIISDYNKISPEFPHDVKRFDFREGAKSVYTDSLSRDWDDIEF